MKDEVQKFVDALRQLEDAGEADALISLFSDEATISNPLVEHKGQGKEAAGAFWRAYRGTFESIRSEFRHIISDDGVAVLEWISTGATRQGPFRYGGVTVLEYQDGFITNFRSYFDPSRLDAEADTRHNIGQESPLVAAQKDFAEDRAEGGGYQ